MLLIEYRVCLPVSVEEYQVAQLYMIMKKSQKESESAGSRVEIMCNEPYEDGPGGTTGQYTRKHYHIGERLPKWATSIITKPVLEEEAWNAYPYTKTKYTCHQAPAMIKDSFSLSIETKYLNDIGNSENVFNLSASELRQRRVYHLDMINDYKDVYVEEEDPLKFVSEKTGRGPLGKNWIKERDGQKEILCAYKLCRIRFDNYFFGQKVENDLIHERALKKLLIHAHRQAWCWQDEYYGLKMEDMRKLEAEAAEDLNKRFANIDANGNIKESTTERSHPEGSEANKIAANNPEKNGTSSAVDAQSRRRKNGKLDSVSSDASNGRLTHEKVPSENGDGFGSTNGQSNDSVVNYISPTSLVKEQLTRSAEASPNQRHSAEPVSRQSTNLIDATEQGGCEVERDSSATESFADLESEGEDEGDKDDEFFDALSQQLCNSTLILDCEPDGTEATGQSQEGARWD